jgi:hypothetical protein
MPKQIDMQELLSQLASQLGRKVAAAKFPGDPQAAPKAMSQIEVALATVNSYLPSNLSPEVTLDEQVMFFGWAAGQKLGELMAMPANRNRPIKSEDLHLYAHAFASAMQIMADTVKDQLLRLENKEPMIVKLS